MSDSTSALTGPDLTAGVPLATLTDGSPLLGHAHGEAVMLVRRGNEVFALAATCTHWNGPLAEGLIVGDTVRCPWHHACFSIRTGEALRAPALDSIARYRVEHREDMVHVMERFEAQAPAQMHADVKLPESIVIVGGGAAGSAAAEMLRREGYAGRLVMLSADTSLPCDRPNLSKGFLAGTAPEEYTVLRPQSFYDEHQIDVRLDATVESLDTNAQEVALSDGTRERYDRLLLATGATPVRLDLPGGDLPHVHYLRTRADGLALEQRARSAKRAVVVGGSFIGLEVAASLRSRGIEVAVVALEAMPMAAVFGPELAMFVRTLHESHGVTFHLETSAASIDERQVTLTNGTQLHADLVVIGVGVRPATGVAQEAGLVIDKGVVVDEYLETSVPGVFAAGDIARFPDGLSGDRVRIEHWVVAQRQGQAAARNMLGARQPYASIPFFWTDQYDVSIAYTGHAEQWDSAVLSGELNGETRSATVTYSRGGKRLAVATVFRDLDNLRAEVEMEAEAGRLVV